MNARTQILSIVMALASMAAAPNNTALGQSPLGNSITYQGRIRQSGTPVNAAADLQFRLFNASTVGTQIGNMLAVSNATVTDGYFTATLDFGAGAFNGEARWLQIAVRSPAGSGSFVTLAPRQPLSAAPYALKVPGVDGHSLDAADGSPANALYVNNTGHVGIGTTSPQAPFDVRSGGGSYFQIDSVNGDIHMNGGTDGAAGIYNDTLGPDALTAFVLNGAAHMVVNGKGRVGIGALDPASKLDVQADWENGINVECGTGNAVLATTASHSGAAVSASNGSPTGQAFGLIASSSSPDGQAIRAFASASSGVNYAVYGLCNSSSGYDFFAGGAGVNYGSTSSRRWKRNVEPIADALAMLSQMRGVYFDWDAEHGGQHDVGMIAEEVGAVLPEVVAFEKNGVDASGMDYSKLTPLLVEAIKQQQAQIDGLQVANSRLQKQIEDLTPRMPAKR